jgi:hypothetical protein
MTSFNNIKALAYAAFLWLIITGLIGAVYGFGLYFGLTDSPWIEIVAALVAGGIAAIFAKEIGVLTTKQAWTYSLLWLAIPVLLDLIIISPLTDEVFRSWQYWFGHFLVFASPWLILTFNPKK